MSQPIVHCPRCYESWHLGPCRLGRFAAVVGFALWLSTAAAFFGAPMACTPPASPAQHPDAAGDAAPQCEGDAPARACCNLARLGCAVGADPHCAEALRSSPDSIPSVYVVELASAQSKAEARAVGAYPPQHPVGIVECP